MKHWGDCAVHNELGFPKGECDCGGIIETFPEELMFIIGLNKREDTWECPICSGTVKASGSMGHYFCWGKCYCYITSLKYNRLRRDLHDKEGGND